MKLKVPSLSVQQAHVQTVDIGQALIGPISVGELVVNNVNFALLGASGVLNGTSITVTINITFKWHIHIGLPWPLDDIDTGATHDFPPIVFGPIGLGNITLPGLNNIQLNIPSLNTQNLVVTPNNPITIHLTNVTADGVMATNFTLPSQGFTLAGMGLTSINGNGIGVPLADMEKATVKHLYGDPINIPAFSVGNFSMTSAQIPGVSSTAPLNINAVLPTQNCGFGDNNSFLSMHLYITPSALMHVDHLEISNATASVAVGNVTLHNVALPYDVLNIKLADIGINTLVIPSFNVT
jgi:hypothetical protein